MPKHHHQSNEEQRDNKAHGAALFHHEKTPYRAFEVPASPEHSSIQIRAYQIYKEKGGSHLDNWLEAERTIRNIHG